MSESPDMFTVVLDGPIPMDMFLAGLVIAISVAATLLCFCFGIWAYRSKRQTHVHISIMNISLVLIGVSALYRFLNSLGYAEIMSMDHPTSRDELFRTFVMMESGFFADMLVVFGVCMILRMLVPNPLRRKENPQQSD